jgi:hypothetical protein
LVTHKFFDPESNKLNQSIYDGQGNYLHRTALIKIVNPEPEFFNVYEFLSYENIIDGMIDKLNSNMVQELIRENNLYVFSSPEDYRILRPFFAENQAETYEQNPCCYYTIR